MARQTAAIEVNTFVRGIITEASPLTFPENASIDEQNMVLNKDGSRERRLGMDYEEGYATFSANVSAAENPVFNSFVWKQPGGFTESEFSVVQSGRRLTFIDNTATVLSAAVKATYDIGNNVTSKISLAAVDGILVAATGSGDIYAFDYDGANISQTTSRLKIRDMFGVEDIINGQDLRTGQGVQVRPSVQTDAHIYNLRNQTFAYPRYRGDGDDAETSTCPIFSFHEERGTFQANSDNLITYLYANANDSDDRNTRRYFQKDNLNNPLGTNLAPMGFFIIDAMNRGASRLEAVHDLYNTYPELQYPITALPTDSTPGGASVVATYAGRAWFAGFSSQVVDGDKESPRMTSYVLFSRLVDKISDIYKCYQDGDPTSSETPDLVDTDGGFLRLDGAYNISAMVNVGDALMVVAENGVWKITGGSGYGFSATNYMTTKLAEYGCISPGSVVLVDSTFMYWSEDGIYHVTKNQYGDWAANNISNTTIQDLYDDIAYGNKVACQSTYDRYTRCVRWMFNNLSSSSGSTKELILDVNLSAFYISDVASVSGTFPRMVAYVKTPPFKVTTESTQVIAGAQDTVVDSSVNTVVVQDSSVLSGVSETYFVTIDSEQSGDLKLTFSYYRDSTFTDWVSKDGTGVDAAAYLLTGWTGGGDYQRQKQAPLLTVYCIKTETGFDSEYEPVNSSSVLVQGQWSWTNLADSNKWTSTFQAYRHTRLWAPEDNSSPFNDGNHVIVTRNRLRGRGRVLSLLFKTEPKKAFNLLGWSHVMMVNGSV